MKHLWPAYFLILIFLNSCVSYSVVDMNLGKPFLIRNANILVGEVKNASLATSLETYRVLKTELSSHFGDVSFVMHHEYDILTTGISKTQMDSIGVDPAISRVVSDAIDANYYIDCEILDFSSAWEEENSTVRIQIKIVDLSNLTVSSGYIVTVNSMGYPDESGAVWDFTSASTLYPRAIKKAAKKMQKYAIDGV